MCVRACVRACVSVCLSLSMSVCLPPYILNLKPQPHNPSPSTPYSHSLPQTHWKKVKAATKESKASTEKIIQKHSEKKLDLLENQTKFLRLHDQLQVPIHSCAYTLVSSIHSVLHTLCLAYTLSPEHCLACTQSHRSLRLYTHVHCAQIAICAYVLEGERKQATEGLPE